MENNPSLSGEEICKIIETCYKKGVISLKYAHLEVSFAIGGVNPRKTDPGPTKTGSQPENIIREQQQEEKQALESEEIQTREDQLAELAVMDPVRFEEMMQEGDLVETEESEEV